MAYSKTTWQNGDTITAAKMNKIEQGIYDATEGGGKLYLHRITAAGTDGDTYTVNVDFSVITNRSTPFTSFLDVPQGGYAVQSGTFDDGADLGQIITISVDDAGGVSLNYYIFDFSGITWSYGFSNFLDTVTEI